MTMDLQWWLEVAAVAQLGVAALNLGLVRLLQWRNPLRQLPLLMREVFQVHVWFISLTLAAFGGMTLRFAGPMAAREDPAAIWLAAIIAIFWGLRVLIQLAYYSASHWRHDTLRTMAHIVLLIIYGGMAVAYGMAAWGA